METGLTSRRLYRPLQPSVYQNGQGVRYYELEPGPHLGHLIYCYWELKSTVQLEDPFHYTVAADGCIDLYFETSRPDESYAMGFSTAFTRFPLGRFFRYAGVRFLPAAFPLLFRVDASELTNRSEDLKDVAPAAARFIASAFDTPASLAEIRSIMDHFFLKHLNSHPASPDPRLSHALDIIIKKGGNLTLKHDLDIGLSDRQLRRLFATYIGGTVKTFSSIVRFQHALNMSLQSTRQRNSSFFDAGYYDQAHFIKEFKTYYGDTPGKAAGFVPE